jgi:hypothetical protein
VETHQGFWDWLGNAGTVLAVLATGFALLSGARSLYRRTLGRRRDRYTRLARLGARAQLSFFSDVLGESPAMRTAITATVAEYDEDQGQMVQRDRVFIEAFFIDRDYYVQAVCDEDETVVAFSITSRSRRFKPTLSFPPRPSRRERRRIRMITGERFAPLLEVTLGRSRFDEIVPDAGWQPQRRGRLGARTFDFTELYYFGNPGYYQHYGFTASSAAVATIGRIERVVAELGHDWTGGPGDLNRLDESDVVAEFRAATVVTTYTVIGPHFNPENYPTQFGPHGDEVRVLP